MNPKKYLNQINDWVDRRYALVTPEQKRLLGEEGVQQMIDEELIVCNERAITDFGFVRLGRVEGTKQLPTNMKKKDPNDKFLILLSPHSTQLLARAGLELEEDESTAVILYPNVEIAKRAYTAVLLPRAVLDAAVVFFGRINNWICRGKRPFRDSWHSRGSFPGSRLSTMREHLP
jgi:hypothetical protein